MRVEKKTKAFAYRVPIWDYNYLQCCLYEFHWLFGKTVNRAKDSYKTFGSYGKTSTSTTMVSIMIIKENPFELSAEFVIDSQFSRLSH